MQALSRDAISFSADLWALGCIIFHMLTGLSASVVPGRQQQRLTLPVPAIFAIGLLLTLCQSCYHLLARHSYFKSHAVQ